MSDEEQVGPASVMLVDEDGIERRFTLHDAFDVEDCTYYLVEAEDEPDLVLILREEESGLVAIEGPEFDRIVSILENESSEA